MEDTCFLIWCGWCIAGKDKAKKLLKEKPISEKEEVNLQEYILDKLDLSKNDFEKIMNKENKNFRNFKKTLRSAIKKRRLSIPFYIR